MLQVHTKDDKLKQQLDNHLRLLCLLRARAKANDDDEDDATKNVLDKKKEIGTYHGGSSLISRGANLKQLRLQKSDSGNLKVSHFKRIKNKKKK